MTMQQFDLPRSFRTHHKIIAWCPDEADESDAREYFGDCPEAIAEQHAEFVHESCDPCSRYTIRVRATNDTKVHEWDILVEVEINVTFHASRAFRVPRSRQEGVPCLIPSLVAQVRFAIAGSRAADHWTPDACVYGPAFTYRLVPVIACRALDRISKTPAHVSPGVAA